jgi:hypothetical protein
VIFVSLSKESRSKVTYHVFLEHYEALKKHNHEYISSLGELNELRQREVYELYEVSTNFLNLMLSHLIHYVLLICLRNTYPLS